MTQEEQLGRLDDLSRRARAQLASPDPEVTARALDAIYRASELRAQILSLASEDAPPGPDPMTRAHAHEDGGQAGRAAAGLHKLRTGRDQCTATRRDGHQCQAPAIENALVCRRHGGGAPQVRIAAAHLTLQMALYIATSEYREARGTPREFDALCKASRAERELTACEDKLAELKRLRAELRRRKAGGTAE